MKRILPFFIVVLMGCSLATDFDDEENNGEEQVCGDGVVQGTELCDRGNLGGETCGTQGFSGGLLKCADNCMGFDDLHCFCDTCGGNQCVDLSSDAANCGSCGNRCDGDDECHGGVCGPWEQCGDQWYVPIEFLEDVDCEGFSATGNFVCHRDCCEGQVVLSITQTDTDFIGNPNHCGWCGVECSDSQECRCNGTECLCVAQ